MYRVIALAALTSLAVVTTGQAQERAPETNVYAPRPAAQVQADQDVQQPADVSMTPEAWRYLKDQQIKQSARDLIFRRASFRAAQREMRIASREWYGMSLSRPMASPIPFTGIYSPHWAGTFREPSLWTALSPYMNYQVTDEGLR